MCEEGQSDGGTEANQVGLGGAVYILIGEVSGKDSDGAGGETGDRHWVSESGWESYACQGCWLGPGVGESGKGWQREGMVWRTESGEGAEGDFGKDVPDAHAGCHVLRERPPRPLRGEEGVQGRSPWLGFSREPGSLTGLAIATLSDILMEWPRE